MPKRESQHTIAVAHAGAETVLQVVGLVHDEQINIRNQGVQHPAVDVAKLTGILHTEQLTVNPRL